jgi:hypothetical protein
MSMVRITGTIKDITSRSGKRQDGVTDWTMRQARVLVADLDFVEVTLKDDQYPSIGADIDWCVEVGVGGRFLRIGYVKDWPTPAPVASVVAGPYAA